MMMKRIPLLLFFSALLPAIVFSAAINSADVLSASTPWSFSADLTGDFEKASLEVDSSHILDIYRIAANNSLVADEASLSHADVISYYAGGSTVIFVMYPLAEGQHTIKLSLFTSGSLTEEKTKTIEFEGSASSVNEKLDELYSEIGALKRELGRMRAKDASADMNISRLGERLASAEGGLSEKADLSDFSEFRSEVGSTLPSISKKIESLLQQFEALRLKQQEHESGNNGLLSSAFVILGNSTFPLALIIGIIAIFFILNFAKGRIKKKELYDESGFPEPEDEMAEDYPEKPRGRWAIGD
jgi:hypothetical protein